ncbi:hypothetical protein BRARA_A02860 [Brassica rapa]|uniref:Uncharacterized protein n=1 Tax=Brassica campestris TaxID=3711 RepID=A0A398AR24_BRACM|nr:hypothetical protein BRARA_A02860 [Brassica rapa]
MKKIGKRHREPTAAELHGGEIVVHPRLMCVSHVSGEDLAACTWKNMNLITTAFLVD